MAPFRVVRGAVLAIDGPVAIAIAVVDAVAVLVHSVAQDLANELAPLRIAVVAVERALDPVAIGVGAAKVAPVAILVGAVTRNLRARRIC